jgi:hypothetical protein
MFKVLTVLFLSLSISASAQDTVDPEAFSSMPDSMLRDTLSAQDAPPPYYIALLTRGYADRVALRWAPNEYVPWHVLNAAGYVVRRLGLGKEDTTDDTLAIVRPWTIEQFKQHFAPEDSLAGVAVQLIYGGAQTRFGQTAAIPGTASAVMEVYDEQQSVASMALMVAELRPDLAEAMGLMYVDRTARKDFEYSYIVTANIADTLMNIQGDASLGTRLGEWKPQPLDIVAIDSLQPPSVAMVYWERNSCTAFDIERQDSPNGPWRKLNDRPYVSLTAMGEGQRPDNGMNMYQDHLPGKGTYRYRLTGYDSFGDRTLPSPPHEVTMIDMIPPTPPVLDRIVVDHPDEQHATATIYFHADTVEADVKGYLPLYRHSRVKDGEWHPLTTQMALPGDTVMTVDVSGLPTGQLSVAAYDEDGNQGASLPSLILLEDYMAPSAPTNLRANVAPDGYLELRWTPSPEADVAFYEVFSANDSTHVFMNVSNADQTDTLYTDSLALGLNQAYIYYKVRAVDYSGNASESSEMLRVIRPNYIPPMTCRIDSVWMTDDGVHMRWIQSNEEDLDYHRLFRKLDGDATWTLMGVYRADSLRSEGNMIRFSDTPTPNMRTRYVYAVETRNLTGVTSGLSMPQTFLFTGPRIVDISLKLLGSYDSKSRETRLAWDTGRVPDYGPWYYCVYRKGQGDDRFQFLLATKPDDPQWADALTREGESAAYYVTVQYEDGRHSRPSNTVTVKAE